MINASFPTGYKEITVPGLTQWDKNQTIKITGLGTAHAAALQVHFQNKKTWQAIVYNAVRSNDLTYYTVSVPNSLLQDPHEITAFICAVDGETKFCTHIIHLPVKTRQKPEEFASEPDKTELDTVNEIYALLETYNEPIDLAMTAATEAKTASATATSLVNSMGAEVSTALGDAKTAVSAANSAIAEANQIRTEVDIAINNLEGDIANKQDKFTQTIKYDSTTDESAPFLRSAGLYLFELEYADLNKVGDYIRGTAVAHVRLNPLSGAFVRTAITLHTGTSQYQVNIAANGTLSITSYNGTALSQDDYTLYVKKLGDPWED